MDAFTETKLRRLRRPFADDEVQLKPVYTGSYELDTSTGETYIPKDAYGKCPTCGKYHDLPAKHLRYVGHALITQRLNEVDPEWTWEPMATDEAGLPLTRAGNLWIRLTVCGITRIGVGDAGGKIGAAAEKEMIGDAIRNAAMRFGCGLEFWIDAQDEEQDAPKRQETQDKPPEIESEPPFELSLRKGATRAQTALFQAMEELVAERGVDARALCEAIEAEFGSPFDKLTAREVDAAIEFMELSFPEEVIEI